MLRITKQGLRVWWCFMSDGEYELRVVLTKALRRIEELESARREPIAIVGMACRFPGGAEDPDRFWSLLAAGADAIVETPPARVPVADDGPRRANRRAGLLAGPIDMLDADFFGIAPREAAAMDPQQRLILEVAWEAMEDAALAPGARESRAGVFLGVSWQEYQRAITPDWVRSVDAHTLTGTMPSIVAGRVSYLLGLRGPAVAIDTACSSSLVAVHQAVTSLRAGECEVALAGGVNLLQSELTTEALARMGALSPDGHCRPFDAAANGYVRGEGAGVVVLKRLSAAVADGDDIRAVIRGSAVNHDGRSLGLTAPNPVAQTELVRTALADAGCTAEQIGYLEAHGTGTPLGDPIEIEALAQVFPARPDGSVVRIGSVKAQIGHLEAAAGIAGLIKTVLMFERGMIPRQPGFDTINPRIILAGSAFEIAREDVPWPSGAVPRRAGVSSFGFAGTNAHVVLEEAPALPDVAAVPERPELLVLSARTESALAASAQRYRARLVSGGLPLPEVAATAALGRQHFSRRRVVVARSVREAADALGAVAPVPEYERAPRITMLFTGQGSQYAGMGRALFGRLPVFRDEFERCDRAAGVLAGGLRLRDLLFDADDVALSRTEYAQPVLFAVEWAAARLWESWGVRPAAVLGHSLGELVAAAVAGAFGPEEGVRLAVVRGRLMQGAPRGAMAALFAAQADFAEELAELEDSVAIAAVNAPGQFVVSGSVSGVRRLRDAAEALGVRAVELPGDTAFHSPLLDPVLDEFERAAADLLGSPRTPSIPLVSNIAGVPVDSLDARHWRDHARSAVRFADSLRAAESFDTDLYLEVGPHPVLLGFGRQVLGGDSARWLATMHRAAVDEAPTLVSLGEIYRRGGEIDWGAVFPGKVRRRHGLPTYPFERRRYVVSGRATEVDAAAVDAADPAVPVGSAIDPVGDAVAPAGSVTAPAGRAPVPVGSTADQVGSASASIDGAAAPAYLAEHRYRGRAIVPAAYLAVTALRAVGEGHELKDFAVTRALPVEQLTPPRLSAAADGIEVAFDAGAATGLLVRSGADHAADRDDSTWAGGAPVRDSGEFYRWCAGFGLEFGLAFRWIIGLRGDGERITAQLERPAALAADPAATLVCLVDAAVQTGLALYERGGTAHLPIGIGRMRLHGAFDGAIARAVATRTGPTVSVRLFDRAGSLLVEMDEITYAATESAGTSASLELPREASAAAPATVSTKPVPVRRVQWQRMAGAGIATTRSWLVFGTSAETVAAGLRSAGQAVQVAARGADRPTSRVLAHGAAGGFVDSAALATGAGGNPGYVAPSFAHESGDTAAPLTPPGGSFGPEDLSGHALVYVLSGDAEDPETAATAVSELLTLVRTAADTVDAGPLFVVTTGATAVLPGDRVRPAAAALRGMCAVVRTELPEFRCRAIDVPGDELGAAHLVDELRSDAETPEVSLRAGVRYVPVRVQHSPPAPPAAVRPDASYLITGGFGALGEHVAELLVECGARTLVLAGRNTPGERAAATIARARAAGVRVDTVTLDLDDRPALAALIARFGNNLPPLRGLLHCAGVTDDAPLIQQTAERVRAVFAGKSRGAWHLHELTAGLSLDLFVLFSSVSAVIGTAGQANYAAANAYLDGLAELRLADGLPAVSIQWGPWAGTGMAAALTPTAVAAWHRKGVGLLDPVAGRDILRRLLTARGVYSVHPDPSGQLASAASTPQVSRTSPMIGAAESPAEEALSRLCEADSRPQREPDQRAASDASAMPDAVRSLAQGAAPESAVGSESTRPSGRFAGSESATESGAVTLPGLRPAQDPVAESDTTRWPDQHRESAPALAHADLTALVERHAAAALGRTDGIPPRTPLRDLGMDSMMAVDLRNTLSEELHVRLPATLLFNHPTVTAVASELTRLTNAAHAESSTPEAQSVPRPATAPTPPHVPPGTPWRDPGPHRQPVPDAAPSPASDAPMVDTRTAAVTGTASVAGPAASRPAATGAATDSAGAPNAPADVPAALAATAATTTDNLATADPAAPVATADYASPGTPDPIAIVGVGCRYPGDVHGPDDLWQLLISETDAVSEVPPSRWDVDAYFDPDPDADGKTYTRWGGFVHGVEDFDAGFFGISAGEARMLDPQQRLLLEVTWEALEHAGIPAHVLAGSRTGVFTGLMSHDYAERMARANLAPDAWFGTGNLASVASGRLSYFLGAQGPSLTVDTACSSSLVAVHLAARSLRAGESDLAVACGATVVLTPSLDIYFARARGLAADGRCKSFDARADGVVWSDGAGALVLKRLADARRDGDRVLAVIRGTAVNSDGRSQGLSAPNGPAQERVIRAALEDAGIDGDTVDYVEAHGTGTALGDPVEVEAIAATLAEGRPADRPVWIGSVKSNLGHTQAAAGIANIVKVVESLRHEYLPASLHFRTGNPHIDWDRLGVRVAATGRAWARGERVRRAGISAFGISGTNAHIVLEEAPESLDETRAQPATVPLSHKGSHLLAISAVSISALKELSSGYAAFLDAHPGTDARLLCAAANAGRTHFGERVALLFDDLDQAATGLRAVASGAADPGALLRLGASPSEAQDALARRYLGGDEIDWAAEYPDYRGGSLELPHYPFQRKRHWLDLEDEPQVPERPSGTVYELPIVPESFDHHRLHGIPTVPAAWMCARLGDVAAQLPGTWRLERVTLVAPLAVRAASVVRLELSPDATGYEAVFRSANVDDGVVARAVLRPSTIEVVPDLVGGLREETGGAAGNLGSDRQHTVLGTVADPWSAYYDRIAAHGLALGPDHRRGLRFHRSGPNDATAELRATTTIDTALLDSCLHGLALAASGTHRNLFLPTAIDRLEILAQPASGTDRLTLRVRITEPGDRVVVGDVTLSDAEGRILVRAAGVCLMAAVDPEGVAGTVRRGPLVRSDATNSDPTPIALPASRIADLLHHIAWEPAEVGQSVEATGPWWVLGEGTLGAAIADHLAVRDADPLLIEPPTESVDPVSDSPLAGLLDAVAGGDEHVRPGSPPDPVGVVVAWTGTPIPVLVSTVLRLVTYLAESGAAPRALWLVTTGAQRVVPGDRPDPEQALLWGLGRVLRTEHPELRCRLLDLEHGRLPSADSLAAALFSASGDELALRDDRVLSARVAPGLASDDTDYRVQADRSGELDRVRIVPAPRRPPGPGEVQIEVTATGLNSSDVWSARGLRTDGPASLGRECVGRISAVGEEATGLAIGDRVVALADGSLAGWVNVAHALVVPAPAHLSDTECATLPLAFASAWYALAGLGDVRPGGRVLVHAPADGFGIAAVQVAVHLGAEVVVTPALRRWAATHGHDLVAVADWRARDFVADMWDRSDGAGFDVVLSAVTPEFADTGLALLNPRGQLVEVFDAEQVRPRVEAELRATAKDGLMRSGPDDSQTDSGADRAGGAANHAPHRGISHRTRFHRLDLAEIGTDRLGVALARIAALADEGVLRPLPHTVHPAAEVATALRKVWQRDHPGRVVVRSEAAVLPTITDDGTYIVTGAFGGLGSAAARWLADRGARHLLLVARSAPDEAGSSLVTTLRDKGISVVTRRADVGDRAAVAALLDGLPAAGLPPLHGVVHCAGVLDDGVLTGQSWARFQTVLAAKYTAASHFDELTRGADVRLFLTYSSVAGILGTAGQANYAAANAALDALAWRRRAEGLPALSIAWGPFADVGMAAGQESLLARLARAGLPPLTVPDATLALNHFLTTAATAPGVFDFAPDRWYPNYPAQPSPGADPSITRASGGSVDDVASGRGAGTPTADQVPGEPRPRSDNHRATHREPGIDHWITMVQQVTMRVLDRGAPLDPDQPLHDNGVDSLTGMELRAALATELGAPLPAALVFDYPTVREIAGLLQRKSRDLGDATGPSKHPVPQPGSPEATVGALVTPPPPQGDSRPRTPEPGAPASFAENQPSVDEGERHRGEQDRAAGRAPHRAAGSADDDPIVIVGMACRFPGGVRTPEQFWELLRDGRDAVTEVPPDRWDVDRFFDPDPAALGTMYTRWGGFLDGVDEFDAEFFGIGVAEARAMDPQQRLLLETAWEALERSGRAPGGLSGSDAGVFVGLCFSEYPGTRTAALDPAAVGAYSVIGSAPSVAAGRLAYTLGLRGPALTLDTACSSSLVALQSASDSLRAGRCDLALVGGVNLQLAPETTLGFCRIGALSPDGRSRAFGAAANGYVRADGCGVLVVTRLSSARRNGDRVLAVVRGIAVNHDGRSNGLTAPNGSAQRRVLADALSRAGMDPDQVAYVETHGTGTPLGDPIEAGALADVYGGARTHPLLIGSVKSNIGHTEAAAGVAGVIKAVLMLEHGHIPPSLHADPPNPRIPWDSVPLRVATTPLPWPHATGRRAVGVSSFGMSGTNAHVILSAPEPSHESASAAVRTGPAAAAPTGSGAARLLVLSARTETALAELAHRWSNTLRSNESRFEDLAHTAAVARTHFEHRLAVVSRDAEVVARELTSGAVLRGRVDRAAVPAIGVLFTGQGSQYPGMARGLFESEPVFREALEHCDTVLGPIEDGIGLLDALYGPAADRLDRTVFAQPAVFAVEWALWRLWRDWGLAPAAVLGHSVGEYVAACAADAMDPDDALRLVATRGRLMQSLPGDGAMLAVDAPAAQVESRLLRYPALSVAGYNSPRQIVVAGARDDLAALREELGHEGIRCAPLPVSHAFHSTRMDPILDDLAAAAAHLPATEPALPLVSSVTGTLMTGPFTPRYWADQARQPVRFAPGLEALSERGIELFLEVGPSATLSALGRRTLPESATFVASLHRGTDDATAISTSLGHLYTAGAALNWERVFRAHDARPVLAPTYPFQRQRYWIDAAPSAGARSALFVAGASSGRTSRDRTGNGAGAVSTVASAEAEAGYVGGSGSEMTPTADSSPRIRGWNGAGSEAADTKAVITGAVPAAMDEVPGADRRQLGDNAVPPSTGTALPVRAATSGSEIEFTLTLDAADPGFLGDHRLGADVVVPGAWFVTTILTAAKELTVDHPLALEDFVLVTGLTLTGRHPVHLRFVPEAAGFAVEVSSETPDGRQVHARARLTHETAASEHSSVEDMSARCGEQQHPSNFYAALADSGLHYGPAFRRVIGLRRIDGEALATLWGGEFEGTPTHPVLLDAGLHTLYAAMAPESRAHTWVPVAIDRVIAGVTTRSARYAHVRVLEQGERVVVARVRLLDEEGGPVLTADGVRVVRTTERSDRTTTASGSYRMIWRAADPAPTGPVSGRWLVVSDGPLGSSIASELRSRGAEVAVARPGRGLSFEPNGELRVDLAAPAAVRALLAAAGDGHTPISGIVYEPGATGLGPDEATDAVVGALHLTQAAVGAGVTALRVLTRNAQRVEPAENVLPDGAALWGFVRSAQLEHPEIGCHVIDYDASTPASRLVDELAFGGSAVQSELPEGMPKTWSEGSVAPSASPRDLSTAGSGHSSLEPLECGVGYPTAPSAPPERTQTFGQTALRGERRYVPRLAPETARTAEEPARFAPTVPAPDRTILITGGTGGIGLTLADWFVNRGARTLVLLSRGASDTDNATIDRLRERARVEVWSADAADRDALAAVLERLSRELPPLDGVVHLAGVRDDGVLTGLDADRVRSVLAPKLHGARHLHDLTAHLPLRFFVLFSSAAGVVGLPGQAAYGAANAYLDVLAEARTAAGLPALALAWGPWADTGMVRQLSDTDVARLEARGYGLLPVRDALQILGGALDSAASGALTVLPLDPAAARTADLPEVLLDLVAAGDDPAGGAPDPLRRPASDPAGASTDLRSEMAALVRRCLGLAPDADLDRPLHELGLDSVAAMEIRDDLSRATGHRLPATLAFEYPTPRAVAAHLADLGTREAPGSHRRPAASASSPVAGRAAFLVPESISSARDLDGTRDVRLSFTAPSDPAAAAHLNDAAHRNSTSAPATSVTPPRTESATVSIGATHLRSDSVSFHQQSDPVGESPSAAGTHATPDFATAASAAALWTPAVGSGDIAIVGVSGRYPGAPDLDAYWRVLAEARDCVTEIPTERWDHSRYFHPGRHHPHTAYTKWGGFLDDVDCFDPLFFAISPREAEVMDPQERLFLQTAWAAMEDAGYHRGELARVGLRPEDAGVFVGVMWGTYQMFGAEESRLGRGTLPASTFWSIPNRVSHALDLQGPSMAVDTACSSSLSALHLACQSLRTGETRLAVVGGVNLSLHPYKFVALSQGQFASTDGRCRSFGADGDGYVAGEGVGALVLRPLADAEAAGDTIHAVIKGTAVNHGGRVNGFTVPNPTVQAAVIRRALRAGGVDPATVSYIEAHGTGTALGDPIEIAGLAQVFGGAPGTIPLGSVKSNIGHLEAAAGVAALTKVLLQLRHDTIVPSLHSVPQNPNIDFGATPFVVPDRALAWPSAGGPRRATVSSFGAGGANANVVLEEYVDRRPRTGWHGAQIVPVSARDSERLAAYVADLERFLADRQPDLGDLAYTMQVGRAPGAARAAFVAGDLGELRAGLRAWLENRDGARDSVRAAADPTVARWLRGERIDWEAVRGSGPRRRISLPTYPFARERYWIPDVVGTGPAVEVFSARAAGMEKKTVLRAHNGTSSAQSPPRRILVPHWVRADATPGTLPAATAIVYDEHTPAAIVTALAATASPARMIRVGTHGVDRADFTAGVEHGRAATADAPAYVIDLCDLVPAQSVPSVDFGRIGFYRGLLEARTAPLVLAHLSTGDPSTAPLAGLVAGLAEESRDVRTRTVELTTDPVPTLDPERLRALLGAEYATDDGAVRVRYRHGVREAADLTEITAGRPGFVIDPARTYVITGGTRGLGAEFAAKLVERGARRLAILARDPLPPESDWARIASEAGPVAEKVRALLRLRERGATVRTYFGPLTDATALAGFFARVRAELGPIGGVLHCAGAVSSESPAFVRKTAAGIDAVLAPKLAGTRALAETLAADRPDFFVLFSSVSAVLPSLAVGLSDYAMANAWLDRFAEAQHLAGRPWFRSVNWPSFRDTGFGAAETTAYRATGLPTLTAAEGFDLLDTVLGAGTIPVAMPYTGASLNLPVRARTARTAPPAVPLSEHRAAPEVSRATPSRAYADLVAVFSDELKLAPERFEGERRFEEYGADSVLIASAVRRIEELLGEPFDPALVLEYPSLNDLAALLTERYPARYGTNSVPVESGSNGSRGGRPAEHGHATVSASEPSSPNGTGHQQHRAFESDTGRRAAEPIAVVGIGCRLPGGDDPESFWRMLAGGGFPVREVDPLRWDPARFYRPNGGGAGTTNSKWGGFVDGIDLFDPGYFGIADEAAWQMDPLQRLLLESAVLATHDAGYRRDELSGRRIGVYAGSRTANYFGRIPVADRHTIVGIGQNFIAARISDHFDWHAANVVLDSACSSSLVAVHLACQALRAGELDAALAGGVEVLLDEMPYVTLAAAGVLSPHGRCATFDQAADGFVPGEGAALMMLKRLDDAVADGDRIYAVLRGSAVGNDGHTMGITTPNMRAQIDVITAALAAAGLSPDDLSYVEAHGTGTMIGDPIELKALATVLGARRDLPPCAVGSVKTNIGHLLSAAGIAGAVKTVLAVHHAALPPSLHCPNLNPRFAFAGSPLRINRELSPWSPAGGRARVAGVSSFGFGGTNAHLIVAQAPAHHAVRGPLPAPAFRKRSFLLPRAESVGPVPVTSGFASVQPLGSAESHVPFAAPVGRPSGESVTPPLLSGAPVEGRGTVESPTAQSATARSAGSPSEPAVAQRVPRPASLESATPVAASFLRLESLS